MPENAVEGYRRRVLIESSAARGDMIIGSAKSKRELMFNSFCVLSLSPGSSTDAERARRCYETSGESQRREAASKKHHQQRSVFRARLRHLGSLGRNSEVSFLSR